jgi:protein-arginine kinase activator protein McsA
MTFDLAELAAQERSPAARRALRDMEQQLRDLQKQLRELRSQRDTLTTASVRDRLKAVQLSLSGKADVAEVNRALRDAIRRIVIDPEQGYLWIRWHHSEEVQDIPCPSRHMSWEDFRETKTPMRALFPDHTHAPNTNEG